MPQQTYLDPPHDLGDLVRSTLARNAPFIGRDFRVELNRSEVVLRGAVRSWYHKQVAQESLRGIDGVGAIRNELQVVTA